MDHLRFSGLEDDQQRAVLEDMIRDEQILMDVLKGLVALELSQGILVAGAIYNMVWNRLTNRPSLNGVKDIDIFYFDDSDLGYEAEDRVIKRCNARFADLPLPVEPRNQARVHLWFPEKFGSNFEPLLSADEMFERYASKTHAVGVRLLDSGKMQIVAPFGLDDIFSFRIVPNPVLDNKRAHDAKGERAKQVWPEISVVPWPEEASHA